MPKGPQDYPPKGWTLVRRAFRAWWTINPQGRVEGYEIRSKRAARSQAWDLAIDEMTEPQQGDQCV